jgi:glycosyltransferase involved in cell wall biosynthesis
MKNTILSSDSEGIPNVVLEAMAAGLPVVCTDFDGGGREMTVTNGENGLVVSKGDCEAFGNAILRLLTDEKLYASLSEQAYRKSREFGGEKNTIKWIEFLKEVLSEKERRWIQKR